MRVPFKPLLVVGGAIVCSTIAIQASDALRGIDGNLASLITADTGVCGAGAVLFNLSSGSLCVDVYEASPNEKCIHTVPRSAGETQQNINNFDCMSVSQADRDPWRYVSMQQAQQLCARVGKRLPNNDEWYAIASGLSDDSECVIDSAGAEPTSPRACVTHTGVQDVVGNLWEWVDGEVQEGAYNNRPLPPSGYVDLVDSDGVVLSTSEMPNEEYGADYALTAEVGVYGMVRGGFFGSREDAGLYAQNLSVPLDLKAAGVGFRCVQSL